MAALLWVYALTPLEGNSHGATPEPSSAIPWLVNPIISNHLPGNNEIFTVRMSHLPLKGPTRYVVHPDRFNDEKGFR